MMTGEKKISDGKLLYDPMFAQKPVLDWTDSENGKFFGKAVFKKTVFIIILILAICGSLFFSFSSLSKDRYEFSELENGTYKLDAFHGQKTDTVLCVDYVRSESGEPDPSKTVTAVRQFTVTGNDTLQFIFIGKDVTEIEPTAFYYCTALNAVFVDDENTVYTDIDGVLYKKDNGVVTEIVLCPQRHSRYELALTQGKQAPATPEEARELSAVFADEQYTAELDELLNDENAAAGKKMEIPETVTVIGQLCFAYCDKLTGITLPKGLKEIQTMAFFNCSQLGGIDLPDGLETIGSDAFSKCGAITYLFIPESVKTIGHHAFWNCGGIEKVYMAAASEDGMETGSTWKPQYRKTFMKNRETVYNAVRGVTDDE